MYNTNKCTMSYCSKRNRRENEGRRSESRSNQKNCNCMSSRKKNNSRPQGSCGFGNNSGYNNKPDVVYYPCKEADCDNYICRANNLIGEASYKTNSLNENLMAALENQDLVGQELYSIKDELTSIANALEVLKKGLCAAQNALNNAVDNIDENAIYNQNNAVDAIKDAIDDQECIDNTLGCLEAAVNNAFECLQDTGCPILVPKPSNGYGCDCDNYNLQNHCNDNCDDDCN